MCETELQNVSPDFETKFMEIFGLDFWREWAGKLFDVLSPFLIAGVLNGGELGKSQLVDLGVTVDTAWDLTNEQAVQFVQGYGFQLVSGITDTSRNYLQSTIGDWIQSGEPLPELIDKINASGMFGPVRSEMIAVTETTRAYAEGNLQYWRNSEKVKSKRWSTAFDDRVCPICAPLHMETVPIGAKFSSGDFNPPAHVRCRCDLKPVLELE